MELRKLTKEEDLSFFEKLNDEAFDVSETFSIQEFLKAQDEGLLEILSIETTEPVGYVVISANDEVAYLGYFAIDASKRGQGLGGEALELIKERYAPRQLVLETEKVDCKTPYESIKMRRRRFYLAHHLHLSHYEDIFRGNPYQIMCTHANLRLKAFKEILEQLLKMGYDPVLYKEGEK